MNDQRQLNDPAADTVFPQIELRIEVVDVRFNGRPMLPQEIRDFTLSHSLQNKLCDSALAGCEVL
jgi:hypothetical protein